MRSRLFGRPKPSLKTVVLSDQPEKTKLDSFQNISGGKIWRPSRLRNGPEQNAIQQKLPAPMMSAIFTDRPGLPSLDLFGNHRVLDDISAGEPIRRQPVLRNELLCPRISADDAADRIISGQTA